MAKPHANARLLLCAVAALLAQWIIRDGLAHVLIERDPAMDHRLMPGDARPMAALAGQGLAQSGNQPTPAATALARAALARDAGTIPAIELTGLARPDRAPSLFALSARLSRRSLPTQLWLLNQAVAQDRADTALNHIAIALRTSAEAGPVLFPVLNRALADQNLARAIAAMADQPSEWRERYLQFMIARANPDHAAALMMQLRDRPFIVGAGLDQAMLARLVAARRYALARRVAAHFAPLPDAPLVDPAFAEMSARFPFGWRLGDGDGIEATRAIAAGKTFLAITAAPGRAGIAAEQLLVLPPGTYHLASAHAAPGLSWSITCADTGQPLATLDLATPAQTALVIPASNCAGQWLRLSIAAGTIGPQAAWPITLTRP